MVNSVIKEFIAISGYYFLYKKRAIRIYWFLKSSLETKSAHFMRFVEKSYPRPQAVSSKDKIPFEEPH